ncbi:MAG TPA: SusC/RagA family TonB-linked outer membrane protein [Gemmatimonadaceae bacterium]|nr:SusC/RagA family TonB-linked outer membrane protein [Gemmatimonadaceae bacterium]
MESRKLFRLCLAVVFGFCSLILSTSAHGQGAVITGKVTSDAGREIEGANVTIPELNISVGTNAAGNFTISIPAARLNGAPATLRVRAIGFVPRSSLIALSEGPRTANFALAQDINRLEAVVTTGVTGATSQLKLPFSVSRIDSSDMKVPAANPLSQLAGKVPGAQIVAASGRPGASPAVILRGPTAITGAGRGQAPLYIVDGVILADQGTLGGGGLPDVNPLDIESVEVIKGAAASSLYGARAGNGVINIRTKSGVGANEGIRVGARTEFGSSDIEHHLLIAQRHALLMDETGTRFCVNTKTPQPVAGAYQCLQTVDYAAEARRINGQGGDFPLSTFTFPIDPGSGLTSANPALRNQFLVNRWPGANYDAVSQFVTPKPVLNNSLDMRGKYGQTSFYASASAFNQGGAIKYLNGLQRTTGRINLDQQISSKWTASLTSYYAHDQNDGYFQEGGNVGGGAFFRLTRTPPIVNLNAVDSLGRLYIRPNIQGGGLQNNNPLYTLQNDWQVTRTEHFIGGGTLRYQPTTWADLEGNISYDGASSNWNNFDNKGYRTTSASVTNQGFTEAATQKGQSYNSSATLNIRHEFGSSINSRTSFRYLFERQDNDFRDAGASKLIVVGIPSLNNAIDQATKFISSSASSVRSIGFFAAQDFDIADRYIIGGLIRRDGSSLFGAANRWKTFGRGSLAWRVSQEPWWFVAPINEFKLRASVGTAGGRPGFSSQYETYNLSGGQVTPSTLGNRFLKPETIREVELGVDAELFHRIGFNLTHAKSNAFDQILLVPAPAATGFGQQYQNAGVLQNKTWEASLNVPILDNFHDVTYSTRLIYSTNRAVITHLYVPSFNFGATAQNTGALFLAKEGERYGTFYGRAFAKSCSQLPSQLAASCGTPGAAFQKNSDGWIVWVGQGNTIGDGVTKNLWNASLPANSPFYAPLGGKLGYMNPGVAVNWGMPIIIRDSTGTAIQTALGNPLPNFRWGLSQNLSYKGFSAYALIDAAIGQHVYNQGRGWSYLDFLEGREDQTGKTVEAAKPIGYYYRAGAPDAGGIGGFYDLLGANNAVVENASYAKLREVNIGYHIGTFGRLGGDWSLAVIGRNLHTWTHYTGFDPEVGLGAVSGTASTANGAGSAAINAIDAFTFPNLRSYTFSLSTSF